MKSLKTLIFCILIQNTIMAQPLLDNPDIRIFPSTSHHQVEVSTVISRLYPNSILATAIRSNLVIIPLPNRNRTNFYTYSYDGGITWLGNNNLPNNANNGPDPLAIIDADGRGYLGYLRFLGDNPEDNPEPNIYGISKASIVNNFSIWNNQVNGCSPQIRTYFNDKPWIVADK